MPNSNHPPKGSRIFVDPIRSLEDIKTISQLLAGNPRNHLLWTIGINNGLRAVDLLRLKVKDVKNLKPGQSMCAFHSFRSGQGKQDAKKRDAAIKKQCRYCMQGNSFSIRSCTSRYCPIAPYRNHKTDRTYFYPASWLDGDILNSGLPN